MLPRTLTAVAGLAVLAGGLWGGLPWVFLITVLAATLGVREFYRLHPPIPSNSPEVDAGADCLQLEDSTPQTLPLNLEPEDPKPTEPAVSVPLIPLTGSEGREESAPEISLESPVVAQAAEARAEPEGVLSHTWEAPPIPSESNPSESNPSGVTPLPVLLGMVWVAALVIGGAAADDTRHFWTISLAVFMVGAFVGALWLIAFYQGPRWPVAASYLLIGPIYVGFLLAHVMLLAQVGENLFYAHPSAFDFFSFPDDSYDLGRNWLVFALLTTFATDTGAYLVGRTVGRRPMAPHISPNKTWEGAVGGFAGALIAALLLERLLNLGLGHSGWGGEWLSGWNWQPLLIGATVGIVSQAGDLLESRLKRLSGVKDSGVLMPGHGGLLDRLDSLLVTIPVVYYLLVTVARP